MSGGDAITFGGEMGQSIIADGKEVVPRVEYAGLLICFRESN